MKLMRVPFLVAILLLLTIMPAPVFAEPAVYEPVSIEAVSGNAVNELGGVFAKFTAGRLHQDDFVIFRLPEGFIWTTADVKSNISSASRWIQSTEQWNSITYDIDSIRYGTKNYVLVPDKYAGKENGLFQNNTPVLHFTSLNEREVKMEIIEEPKPGQDCCFYLYPQRIFVASGYEGNIGITIDAFDDSGFAYNDNLYVSVECTDAGSLYAGLGGQRIGTIKITEDIAGQIISDTGLTLQLPLGARWEKVCDAENNGLKVAGVISGDGRTAEFKFMGSSKAAANLQLKDMEVYTAPDMTGDLIVEVGGTAGFTGELPVAGLLGPAVAFTIGQDHFIQNGAEYKMDTAPYIKNGITYLPVRYIARALDIADRDIIWNPADRSVVIVKGTRFIKFVVNSNIMYINGISVSMDAMPEVVEPGRTMAPLRWVAQAFGANIVWNEESKTIIIN